VKRFLSYFYKIPKRLIASVEDLIEGEPTTTTIPETTTTIPEEPTTTTESTTTTIADEPETTTTTIPEETTTTAGSTPTTSTDEPETTTTLSDISEETTTTLEQSSSGNLNTTTSSQPIRNNNISNPQEKTNPLVVKEEVVPMENFKIRSAILFTPDRKKFRNNISIKENKDSYTITVKHGPELVPGKYDLVIKYFDKDEFYKHTVSFI